MAELLKKMSEINAVSGNEDAMRSLIISEIEKYCDEITVDSMGNVIALKKGSERGRTVAAVANMDEAGFIVSDITDKGYLKFKPVGNVDPRKLISKRVLIGGRVKGIIGMKAIHLQTKSERENVTAVSKLFIDIGAKDKKDAQNQVSLGDYVTFDTEFSKIGGKVKGKALDRSGVCYALINALSREYTCDVYACFLVQHEVGSRGAKIVAHRLNADAVVTVSSVETEDMHGCEKDSSGARLGGGAAVVFMDKSAIADRRLTQGLIDLADKSGIKIQTVAGGHAVSDAGAMQTGAYGTPCINIAVPCRYSHSPVSIMDIDDIESVSELTSLFLNKIGEMI